MVGQKYEEGLRVAEMRYRSFYEKSGDALMTLDPSSGLFTFANPSAIAMFGARDEADFVSRALWQYSSVRQPNGRDSAELAKETIETAVRDGCRFIEWTCAEDRRHGVSRHNPPDPDRVRWRDDSPGDGQGYYRGKADGGEARDQTPAAGRYQPASAVAPHAAHAGPETRQRH